MRPSAHAIGSAIAWSRSLFPAPRSGFRVLAYHAVGTQPSFEHYGISIDPSHFRDQLDELAARSGVVQLQAILGPNPTGVALTFDDGFRDALEFVAPAVADRGIPATVFVTIDFARGSSRSYLSPGEIRALASMPGIEIGSHCVSHQRLTGCDDTALATELRDSRHLLEDWTGVPVTSIAYPHGAVDRRVRDAASSAGYEIGCTARYGNNGPACDPMLLNRVEVLSSDSMRNFREKLRGDWDWWGLRHGGRPEA